MYKYHEFLGGTFQKILDREDVITRVQDLIAGVKK